MTKTSTRGNLIHERKLRGWSQQEVADRIGTTHLNVSRWEHGYTMPGPYYRRKLCSLFRKSEEELGLAVLALEWPLHDPAIPLQPAIHLVGRGRERARLSNRLTAPGTVALTGLPGVGKTALAIELAHDQEIQAHFHDGILWGTLGPEPNMLGLLSRWGAMLGISSTEMASLSDSEAWAMALHRAIGSRSLLVVIDDTWRVEDAVTLKVGGPNCAHLVTTRFPSIATAVAPGGASSIRELDEDDSMSLLRMLAPMVVGRGEQKAHDLIHAVGGLPLALTLMGNYLRMHAYSGQARRIDAALKRLSSAEGRFQMSEPRGPVERHSSLPAEAPLSLRSVFATSFGCLDERARAALHALAAFAPVPLSFSEEDAQVATCCSVEDIDLLYDAGLLQSAGADRYVLHPLVADYTRLYLHA
jgi:transcriptional regulator with XRE-family HTH domain